MNAGRRLKICYAYEALLPSTAAHTVNIAKMCSALAAHAEAVTLVCSGPPAPARTRLARLYGLARSFPVFRYPKGRKTGGIRAFAAFALLVARLRKAQVIYTRGAALGRRAADAGFPVVLELHASSDALGPQSRADFERLAASPRLIQIVAISQALAEDIATRHPQVADRLFVAHDGADAPHGAAEPLAIQRKGRMAVGYVGHLYPGKGMEVIARLAPLCPWADFHVVGGTPHDLARWKETTAGLDNLIFHGFVPHADTPRYLAAFDAVVAPYQQSVRVVGGGLDVARWMSPLKIFEYMAAAKPIVCSRLLVLEEVLTDERTALLCDPDEPSAWAAALKRLRDEPGLAERLGQSARSEFLERYTWERRAELILADLAPRLAAQTL